MEKGFTLVELIIVISIIALLSTIGITTYSSVQSNARNVRRKSDLKEMKTALEAFKAKNGDYPVTDPSSNIWWGTCSNTSFTGISGEGGTYEGGHPDTGLTGYIPGLAPDFIPKLPRDPKENKSNPSSAESTCDTNAGRVCYLYRSNGFDYKLIARCTPEGELSPNDPYYDFNAVRWEFSWAVYSSNNSRTW